MTDATIRLWGRDIGAVTWLEDEGYGVFQYTPEFAVSAREVAPLVMPLAERAVIGVGVLEAFERRHLHMVRAGCVVGATAAMADFGSTVVEEGVDAGDPFVRIDDHGFHLAVAVRQTVNLIDVEDGVGLQEPS